jgi:hypothetical protein
MHPLNKPEVMVGIVQEKMDGNNLLTDERTRDIIKNMLVSLVEWTERLKQK